VLYAEAAGGERSDAATLFDETVASYRGRRVSAGGEFAATFDGPERAIRCACVLVAAGPRHGITLKTGIHTGECELAGDRRGVPFRMAAALATGARDGEVVVSRTVRDLVSGSRLEFENRGSRRVSGVDGTWETYAAVLPDDLRSSRS